MQNGKAQPLVGIILTALSALLLVGIRLSLPGVIHSFPLIEFFFPLSF